MASLVSNSCFGRGRRLLRERQFDEVLRFPAVRMRRGALVLAARPNGRVAARLGLVVGKRLLRRAVDRNRAKRVIREAFRQHADLPAMDMVVRLVGPRGAVRKAQADWLFSALAARLERERTLPQERARHDD